MLSDMDVLRSQNLLASEINLEDHDMTPSHQEDESAYTSDHDMLANSTRRKKRPGNANMNRVIDEIAEEVSAEFEKFLEEFKLLNEDLLSTDGPSLHSQAQSEANGEDDNPDHPNFFNKRPYLRAIVELKTSESTTITVDFKDLIRTSEVLASTIASQYNRVQEYLSRAVQSLVRKYIPSYLYISSGGGFGGNEDGAEIDTNDDRRGRIMRDFWVAFVNLGETTPLRLLRSGYVGTLQSITGTVTRTSEVRPELLFATFECLVCRFLVKDVPQQFKYTEPSICSNPTCQNRVLWELVTGLSKFTDWQKVRVQENANEIPSGAMPRSIDVILRNEIVEKAKAGDKVLFTGMLIVVPDVSQLSAPGRQVETIRGDGRRGEGFAEGVTGLKSLGAREMSYRLAFLACHAVPVTAAKAGLFDSDPEDLNSDEVLLTFTKEEIDELRNIVSNPQVYNNLVKSIAPQVFGHDEIKRGILLQLMGGVHKTTPEGIKLRGDLNICIVGDPSTSKSQFLKYVCSFMPRSIYTSGKASSAAGLTAAVVKDEETGEFTIEAGALMLADNGICAIDEFDKMDIKDQVAIHEAMEQQTISIAKAGIQATLNARASILAAANPVNGRYDKRLTLRQNVAMSPPIMSRFDLFFVVLDECDQATDYNIARHIINVHRYTDDMIDPEYSTEQVQRYIKFARTFKPKITNEAKTILVEQYQKLRQDSVSSTSSTRITVRQLESMIRLSEALARVHCDEYVTPRYAREAFRLLQKSIIQVESGDVELEDDLDLRPENIGHGERMTGGGNVLGSDVLDDSGAGNKLGDVDFEMQEPQEYQKPSQKKEKKEKIAIDAETFKKITNMLVLHLRSRDEDDEGIRRSDLIQWYLEELEDEIQTEEDLNRHQKLVKLVIRHLVKKDKILIEIRSTSVLGEATEEEEADPFLVVHPEYVLDGIDY